MAARRTLHRTRTAVLMCTLLVIPVGCDMGDPSHTPRAAPSRHAGASATAASPDGVSRRPVRKKPVPVACPSERTRSWTLHDIATVSRGVEVVGPLNMVVSRAGKATLAWTVAPGGFRFLARSVRIADVPPAPGDPQHPPGTPDPQDPLDAQVDAAIAPMSLAESANANLGIDATDVQTLQWHEDLLTPKNAGNIVRSI